MTKCDFCTEYNPKKKKCSWKNSPFKEDDCKEAIRLMVKTLKKKKGKNK